MTRKQAAEVIRALAPRTAIGVQGIGINGGTGIRAEAHAPGSIGVVGIASVGNDPLNAIADELEQPTPDKGKLRRFIGSLAPPVAAQVIGLLGAAGIDGVS
jgi:hypothetical protein